jgi:hypothetical protein
VPRPRGTVADAHKQALNRGCVLLPLRGTSPPPGGAGLLPALARASSDGPLPTAVEATTTGCPMSSRVGASSSRSRLLLEDTGRHAPPCPNPNSWTTDPPAPPTCPASAGARRRGARTRLRLRRLRARGGGCAVGAAHTWCQLMLDTLADTDAPWRRTATGWSPSS